MMRSYAAFFSSMTWVLMNRQSRISETRKTAVGRLDDALGDGGEMGEERERSHEVDDIGRRPAAEGIEHEIEAAHEKQKTSGRADDEGDHLILGEGRQAGAQGQERARHQPAADVAGDDDAVVRGAQIVDGEPHREGERERDRRECPRRQELAEHRLDRRDRQRHQQLDRAGAPLLRPQPHADRRHQDHEQPGMEDEEGAEIGLAALEEAADIEAERARQREKDDDEDVGERRGEVGRQFALGYDDDVAHGYLSGIRARW